MGSSPTPGTRKILIITRGICHSTNTHGPMTNSNDQQPNPAADTSPWRDMRSVLRQSISMLGFWMTLRYLLIYALSYKPVDDRSFDRKHATDTGGRVSTGDLGIDDAATRLQANLFFSGPRRGWPGTCCVPWISTTTILFLLITVLEKAGPCWWQPNSRSKKSLALKSPRICMRSPAQNLDRYRGNRSQMHGRRIVLRGRSRICLAGFRFGAVHVQSVWPGHPA